VCECYFVEWKRHPVGSVRARKNL